MIRQVLSCVMLIVCICLPGVAMGHMAQDMLPGKWWRVPLISERLDLTAGEKAQLDDLFFQNRRKLLQLMRTLEDQQRELEPMLERDPIDEAAIMGKVKKLEEARTDLAVERFRFILEVRLLLGPERFLKLKGIIKEMMTRKPSPNRLPGEPRWNFRLHFW